MALSDGVDQTGTGACGGLQQDWHYLPILLGWRDSIPEATTMPTRNVVLSEHQHDFVEALVQSGRYQNASEVLREGLRLVEQRERLEAAKLKALQKAAREGWADVAAGLYADVADDKLEDFISQLGRQAAAKVSTAG